MMLTPRMSAAAAVVALTSCLATPNSNASAADTSAPASLSIGIAPAPDNLDPGASGLAVDGWVSINVNASLLYDYQGKLYPGLVTKWTPSADDKTWRLELRTKRGLPSRRPVSISPSGDSRFVKSNHDTFLYRYISIMSPSDINLYH